MSVDVSEYKDFIQKIVEVLPKGAFLTTKDTGKTNTMTIGWGSFGFEWGIPTAEVMVRQSRHTKVAMDQIDEFTLTFPLEDTMKSALSYCGQKSGRGTDKISDCNLKIIPAREIDAPVVSCRGIVLECKTLARLTMDEESTSSEVLDKWYKTGDLHTMYIAKVIACYEI